MTETDISPEAVERLACILEGRGGFVKDSTITATLRALSAALTQSRAETAAAYERAAMIAHDKAYMEAHNAIRALVTSDQSSALAAIEDAAEARGMRKAAGIARAAFDDHTYLGRHFEWHDGYDDGTTAAEAAILAAIPQGDK